IVHQQLVLAVSKAVEDAFDVGLRASILVEVSVDSVPEGDDAEELAGLGRPLGIQRFNGPAKLRKVRADPAVLIDRLDRAVEETVRRPGSLSDLLAAHGRQLVDLLAELGAVGVE